MEILISEENAGRTVLDLLRRDMKFSTRMLTGLKQNPRGILVNGAHVTVRFRLTAGEVLSLDVEREPEKNTNIEPTELPISVLYEDEALIVVNKPFGMPTHPSHGHDRDTLANALVWYYQQRERPFTFRAVSRLDADTTGVVAVAKSQLAASRLSRSHIEGKIRKLYLACLDGNLTTDEGRVTGYIRRLGDSMITRGNFSEGRNSEFAETRYHVLGRDGKHTLVAAMPLTGRTHQLRVHFSFLGCPLCGDEIYGGNHAEIGRQALHALLLSFPHPEKAETMTVTAPLPADFLNLFPVTEAQLREAVSWSDEEWAAKEPLRRSCYYGV